MINDNGYKPIKTKDAFNDNNLELERNINKYISCLLGI